MNTTLTPGREEMTNEDAMRYVRWMLNSIEAENKAHDSAGSASRATMAERGRIQHIRIILQWLNTVREIRRVEAEIDEIPQDREDPLMKGHELLVLRATVLGKQLLSQFNALPAAYRERLDEIVTGVEIEAALKTLRESYEDWHVPVGKATVDSILKAAGLAQ